MERCEGSPPRNLCVHGQINTMNLGLRPSKLAAVNTQVDKLTVIKCCVETGANILV